MRITKKFAGSTSIGKVVFQPAEQSSDISKRMEEDMMDSDELNRFEILFLEKLHGKSVAQVHTINDLFNNEIISSSASVGTSMNKLNINKETTNVVQPSSANTTNQSMTSSDMSLSNSGSDNTINSTGNLDADQSLHLQYQDTYWDTGEGMDIDTSSNNGPNILTTHVSNVRLDRVFDGPLSGSVIGKKVHYTRSTMTEDHSKSVLSVSMKRISSAPNFSQLSSLKTVSWLQQQKLNHSKSAAESKQNASTNDDTSYSYHSTRSVPSETSNIKNSISQRQSSHNKHRYNATFVDMLPDKGSSTPISGIKRNLVSVSTSSASNSNSFLRSKKRSQSVMDFMEYEHYMLNDQAAGEITLLIYYMPICN